MTAAALVGTAATLTTGALAGLFVGSSMVEHAMRRLGAPHWIAYVQAKEAVFGPAMPVLFGIGLVLSVAAAALTRAPLPLAAAALMAGVLAVTLIVHLPLNRRFGTWTGTDYALSWDSDRRRWRDWNVARTAGVGLAWALMVAARG